MNFGILGYGYVGKACHKGIIKELSQDNTILSKEVFIYDMGFGDEIADVYENYVPNIKKDLGSCDAVFICIPTNTDDDVDIVINEIRELKSNGVKDIVIRSTLPIGGVEKIKNQVGEVIYVPEFLRERYWDTDCLKRPLVVGCDYDIPDWLKEEDHIPVTTTEAEMIKMFSNNYGVIRIAYANVFYDIAQKLGANYDVVKDAYFQVGPDQTYMDVPGHDGSRGFGGKCLPKDLDFLIGSLDQLELNHDWFKTIRELNKGWTGKQ